MGTLSRAITTAYLPLLLGVGCGTQSGNDDTTETAGDPPYECPNRGSFDETDTTSTSATILVPEETADPAALATLTRWRDYPVTPPGSYRQHSSRDRGMGEPLPSDLMGNGNRDMNHFVCRSADAIGEPGDMVPHLYDLPTCPDPHVKGFVLARIDEGRSGRLVRFWMTAFGWLLGPPTSILRVYVDGAPEPLIQVPLAQVVDGSAGEIFAAPFGDETPTHVAWYYPVVFAHSLVITIDELSDGNLYYHQTNVVLDDGSTPRCAPDWRLSARDVAAEVLSATDDGPLSGLTALAPAQTHTLAPGSTTAAIDIAGPATIHGLTLRAQTADLPALATVDLRVVWDDAEAAAMTLPLGALFGALADPPSTHSLALSGREDGDDTVITLRLPMPFSRRATWTLENRGEATVALTLDAQGESRVPDGAWGHLHTEYHDTVGPTTAANHPIVKGAAGPGRLAGVCFLLEGHAADAGLLTQPLNFLEGDELMELGGGEPPILGTGTEDYLNGAFYFDHGPFGTPFAQAWGIASIPNTDPDAARVAACRWHALGDAIPFDGPLQMDLEIGPGQPSLLDRYRSVAFLYR